jgi:hypothetical protein
MKGWHGAIMIAVIVAACAQTPTKPPTAYVPMMIQPVPDTEYSAHGTRHRYFAPPPPKPSEATTEERIDRLSNTVRTLQNTVNQSQPLNGPTEP